MKPTDQDSKARYDDLPYSSYAYRYSAPEQLATVASLFGLPSPAVPTARVLELGCGSGGNLVPIALRNPASTLVGVDISGVQIGEGRETIGRLGIDNVTLREADLLDLSAESLGEFDYIIAHGVYSWVPPHVQEALLGLMRRCLSPTGVGYVSYNTYPGWKTKEIVRDAMLMHGGKRPTATEQVAYGRSMLGFLKQTALPGGLMAAALDECMPQIMNGPVDYVAHEYLAPYNQPCYFHEFVDRIRGHGLAYLAEAQPSMMLPSNYSQELSRQLYGALGDDQVRVEQYLDFAVSRVFRQTLVVRTERAEALRWEMDRNVVHALHFAARLGCADGPIRLDGRMQNFSAPPNTAVINVALSGIKQAIDLLSRSWPGTVTREEMLRYALETQGPQDPVTAEVLGAAIDELCEKLVLRGMAHVRLEEVALAPTAVDAVVDPVVRRQVECLAPDRRHVANAWHDSVEIAPLERLLIPFLDGSIARSALVDGVEAAMRDGRLEPAPHAGVGTSPSADALVDGALRSLAESGLLSRRSTQ